MSLRAQRLVLPTRAALVALVLLAWQLLPATLDDTVSIVPFFDAVREAVELITSGSLLPDMRSTAVNIVASFVLATVLGLAVAIVIWRRPTLNRLLNPYLTSYYAIPVIVFYPVLIGIFGLTDLPVIALATGWAIVAVIVSTVTGLQALPAVYHKVVAVYGLSTWQAMRRVYIPGAAPLVFNGLRLAAGYAISGVIAAEFLLSPGGGLGFRVSDFYLTFRTAEMYGCVLVVIVLATAATTLIAALERRIGEQR